MCVNYKYTTQYLYFDRYIVLKHTYVYFIMYTLLQVFTFTDKESYVERLVVTRGHYYLLE